VSPVLLRVLVVDDEAPARRRVLELLDEVPAVRVVAACAGGREAVDALRAGAASGEPVDVLFLDVQMPEVDGFAVIEAMPSAVGTAVPAIGFVTAYDQYAVRAFDAHAADYLLKPFSDERFHAALERAATRARAEGDALLRRMDRLEALLADLRGAAPAAPAYLDRIVLKGRGRVRFLRVEDLAWVAAEGVYVRLHTAQRTAHLHRALLGELEAALDPRRFVRIHRSALVNIDAVEELQQDSHGEYAVLLKDRTVLRLSRTYRPALQARLGQPL